MGILMRLVFLAVVLVGYPGVIWANSPEVPKDLARAIRAALSESSHQVRNVEWGMRNLTLDPSTSSGHRPAFRTPHSALRIPHWIAPNREQNFRTYFTPEGIYLTPWVSASENVGWALAHQNVPPDSPLNDVGPWPTTDCLLPTDLVLDMHELWCNSIKHSTSPA